MLRYTVQRLLTYIPLMIGVTLLAFFYVRLMPGDPIQAMVGKDGSPELVQQLREEFGLNRPIWDQYWDWFTGIFKGDLGLSFRTRRPIGPYLISRLPATLELAGTAMIIAIILGIPAGIYAGMKKNTRIDYVLSLLSLGGLSMPVFWTGTILMLVIGLKLNLLPTMGYVTFPKDPKMNLTYLILPATTVGIGMAPYLARMTRTSIIETLQEPFMAFARAKGLKQKTYYLRYMLRYAICQIVVVLALDIGGLIGGEMLIEELFNWPGMGRAAIRAVIERDYFVVSSSILLFAIVYLFINLAADLIHALLDPRIQLK
jgi:peptide/nickel transport system permease protein